MALSYDDSRMSKWQTDQISNDPSKAVIASYAKFQCPTPQFIPKEAD